MSDLRMEVLVRRSGIQGLLYLPSEASVALALLPKTVEAIIE